MERAADHVILGAGVAGLTLQHVLGRDACLLVDPSPGRYKIGESIIPQHFMEPEVRPLFEIAAALPSATPKLGTLFISDDSVGAFGIFEGCKTLHVARQELEAATAAYFGAEVVRERVESVDVEARAVTTDAGVIHARRMIVDCSGPARIVSRALGLSREVWPVWASWAYHDVSDADDERFYEALRRGDKQFFRFDEKEKRLDESTAYDTLRPTHSTILTRVEDGVWTWQIPLHGARMLSVGAVSRHGPVSAEAYLDHARRSIGPQYRTELRPWDRSGPFNAFHTRNRFAYTSDRFAGEAWALVGDAAFFGDPVYSIGTGFATNHAIQLGRLLREHAWGPKLAEAHQRHTAYLYERAKRAYDAWYFGKVVRSQDAAVEIQSDFLNGRAFQALTTAGYTEAWLVSRPEDTFNEIASIHGEDATSRVRPLLEEDGVLAGWRLGRVQAHKERLELSWERPDAAPMVLLIERLAPGQPSYRVIDGLGLSYRAPKARTTRLDGQGAALVEAFAKIVAKESGLLAALMRDALR